MNENEIWKPICGYEGLYEVSNLGRVKSLNYNHTKQEKILKFGKRKNDYLRVILWKNGKRKIFLVHRLVANAFIDNSNSLPCVNHKDENPSNNCVSNLEWCDVAYNNTYGTAIKRRVENTNYKAKVANTDYKAIANKLTNHQDLSKKVFQYDKQGNLIKIWQSTRECGRQGYNQGNVVACCSGKLKHYKNYIWSYKEIKKEQG